MARLQHLEEGLAALPPIRRTGQECTPAGCARGRTLTIVVCRRIVETRAIRIAESGGIPPILMRTAYRPIGKESIVPFIL